MRTFVKIVNRKGGNAYTTQRKGIKYIARGLAAAVTVTDTGILREIRMLEAAELAMARSTARMSESIHDFDPVTGKFTIFVGDSGGSRLMKQYEGVSGGHRVLQMSHDTHRCR